METPHTAEGNLGSILSQPLMGPVTLRGHVLSLRLSFFICKNLPTLGTCSEEVA